MTKFSIDKKIFEKTIKNQCNYVSFESGYGSTLASVLFDVKKDAVTFASTNGNKLLETTLPIHDYEGKDLKVAYNAFHLCKLKFVEQIWQSKDAFDVLEIDMSKEELKIIDVANKFTYAIPAVGGKYPNYEQLIPDLKNEKIKAKYQTIGVNTTYIQELKNLIVNDRNNLITLSINKEDPLCAILAQSDSPIAKCRTLIMPIQIR